MPTILKFKLFGWCWLWGIWEFEGLDKKNREQGTGNREQRTANREQGRTGNG